MTRASGAVVDPRTSLAMWLRTGRTQRNLTLADVARITKIQPRILEKLEAGNLEGLPADVFVKGFVRSFAKCVGLDETEALDRLGAARSVTGSGQATAVARAFVDSMSVRLVPPAGSPSAFAAERAPAIEIIDVAPLAASVEPAIEIEHDAVGSSPAIEVVEVVELAPLAPITEVSAEAATEAPKKKRASRKKSPSAAPSAAPRTRKKKTAIVEAVSAEAISAETVVVETAVRVETAAIEVVEPAGAEGGEPSQQIEISRAARESSGLLLVDAADRSNQIAIVNAIAAEEIEVSVDDAVVEAHNLAEGSNRISQSQIAVAVQDASDADSTATSGSWQPTMPALSTAPCVPWRRPPMPQQSSYVVPHLVIDDADPDSADRHREREERASREHSRLSFLPPILLDREDRSARQGGLTLAVIILLIAATLTLSYLMRRPSARGDGVTLLDGQSELLG